MHLSLQAERLFNILGLSVTNTLLMSVMALGLLTVFLGVVTRRVKTVPGKIQGIVEVCFEGILGMMDSVLYDRRKSEKYLPLVATIFFFILTSNWLGIMPGVGSIGLIQETQGHDEFVPLFRSAASDLNFTLALAIIAVLGVNVLGVAGIGFVKHAAKFFTFKNPIFTFVGLLEFVSEFAKILSFSFRLFGNVFAGEVLLMIIGVLVPVLVPMPFLLLEIFVGFIQAFVFAMLTLVFISMAILEH